MYNYNVETASGERQIEAADAAVTPTGDLVLKDQGGRLVAAFVAGSWFTLVVQ